MPRALPLAFSLLGLVVVGLATPGARGGSAEVTQRSVFGVFFVAKSENRNQVHYGVRLDEGCAPIGDAPVFAYWRMLERGPLATEPLLSRELPAYGLGSQRALKRTDQGGRLLLTLNALPNRPIVVESAAVDRGCSAKARAWIGGVPALLTSVFVQLRWPFGVKYLVLSGQAPDGHEVRERLTN